MTEESIEHIISVMQKRTSEGWFSDSPDDQAWVLPSLSGKFRRGRDTMDVWFDSGSSWMETGKPADVYLEGSDQHRGWFQSSLLTYVAAQKAENGAKSVAVAPFKTLITHGFTLDAQGKKMSKSLGNTVLPEEVMDGRLLPPIKGKGNQPPRFDALGPDVLRLWAASCDFTSDILIGPSILQPVQSALIKYRTILKMLVGSLHEAGRQAPLTKLDQIALLHLSDTMGQVWEAYNNYEFHRATSTINRWVATDLSAFYLEALKDRLYCGDGGGVIEPIFIGLLRMLAPITPMLVEEVWSQRPSWMVDDNSLESPARHLYKTPVFDHGRLTVDQAQLRKDLPAIYAVHDAVKLGLEQARAAKALGSSLQCSVVIATNGEEIKSTLQQYMSELDTMFVVSSVELGSVVSGEQSWCYTEKFEVEGISGTVHILPPKQSKCSRCWRYLATEEDGLCGRCEDVVGPVVGGGAAAAA